MRSTVLQQLIAVALLGSTSGLLFAQSPPRILHDPLVELNKRQRGRIFYLLHGYEIRNNPEPPHFPKYSTGGHGLIVMVRGPACLIIDNDARETFRSPVFNDEYPQDIHQRLAIDFAARLSAAFGGKKKRRIELLNQYVDLDTLPQVLRYAFRTLRLTK